MNTTRRILNEAERTTVEEMSYRLMSPFLIAINLEMDENDFLDELRTPGTDIRQAFYRGYIRQTMELRESIIKAAQNGSNPAQQELIKFIQQQNNHIQYE